MRRLPVLLLTATALAAGCAGPLDSRDPIADYCAYGAVSDAQLEQCQNHVDQDYVDELDTNAADYSRGELDECLDDAGPYCEDR